MHLANWFNFWLIEIITDSRSGEHDIEFSTNPGMEDVPTSMKRDEKKRVTKNETGDWLWKML